MKRLAIALAAGALLPQPAVAAQPNSVEAAALAQWQAKEARLFAIGWRLVTGNAAFCANSAPALGVLLHDADAYADPAMVRAALGLSGPIGVQAVAPGSQAEGVELKPNDSLLSSGGTVFADLPLDRQARWRRLADINRMLEQEMQQDGRVYLRWRSRTGETAGAEIHGTPACPGRFELLSGSDRVSADGARVLLGENFAGFAYPDELLAAAIAHELAHNLLRHRARLEREGRGQRNVRATEREADRMMPWLLANAGYPPEAAAAFMRRWGPGSAGGQLGGLLRARSHDGWDERAALIEGELPAIAAKMTETGRADWRSRFPKAAP